ncbi:SDR family NAD(P)-dependent oxidoreductase [Schinkia sp. CFF1]
MDFNGRTAIITGSTRGIGRCVAEKLAGLGAFVVVNGTNEARVAEVVESIRLQGGKATGVTGRVEREETSELLVKSATEYTGRIDILVNNAGIIADRKSYKMTLDEFSMVIDVHVKGAFLCAKAVINEMIKNRNGGFIINMTSLAGLAGTVGQVNYSAAKAAINGMTWTLAEELKKDRIQVNAISPAAITDMTRPYIEKAKRRAEETGEEMPDYWEIGTADDVADFIVKLVHVPTLAFSGEIFSVNGKKIGRYLKPQFREISPHEIFNFKT